jgi:hypothetical protein
VEGLSSARLVRVWGAARSVRLWRALAVGAVVSVCLSLSMLTSLNLSTLSLSLSASLNLSGGVSGVLATSPGGSPVFDVSVSSAPDGRRYEMVTPPVKNGALIGSLFAGHRPPVVANSGEEVIAPSDQCFEGPESCVGVRLTEGEPYGFVRTAGGWVTEPFAPPAGFEGDSYWSVNANTGTALFSAPGSPGGPDDFYGREPGGVFTPIGPFGELKPGSGAAQANASVMTPVGVFSTADLSHVVYEPTEKLWAFDESGVNGLYEYAPGVKDTQPLMVGVEGGYEEGENHDLVSVCETKLGDLESGNRSEAVSENGHIVYFTAGERTSGCAVGAKAPLVTGLYARVDGESANAHTVLVSARAAAGCDTLVCEEDASKVEDLRTANFEGASGDGSRVFFTDAQQLTNGAVESSASAAEQQCAAPEPGGCNLYESVCTEPCGPPGEAPDPKARELFDVSETSEAEGPRVQGVMAVSADGSHVYFVAEGVLTGEEENEEHEKAVSGEDNLYVYDEGPGGTRGHVTFITRLAGGDGQEEQWLTKTSGTANVTPDGRFLVFTDDRALTHDDTREEGADAEHAAQVYEYDAATRVLRRISAGEDEYNDDGNAETGNAYIAYPAREATDGSVPIRRDPSMADNGELVFFESPIALVPGALEDASIGEGKYAYNVYEWYNGQVYLVSDGKDVTGDSAVSESQNPRGPTELLGVGVNGADVIFSTFDQLVPEDQDTQRDYYDAHLCSTEGKPCIEQVQEPGPCLEGACQGPVGAPTGVVAPGSATLSGSGNLPPPPAEKPVVKPLTRAQKLAKALKACHTKADKKKRRACEALARKDYGPVHKAKKSSQRKGR